MFSGNYSQSDGARLAHVCEKNGRRWYERAHQGQRLEADAAKSRQSCPTLWDPIDSSPPGSPIPGILQARILEWVAISFSSAWKVKSESEVTQSCPTLRDPMDCSQPGSSINGISQARVLEWVAIAFSETGEPMSYVHCLEANPHPLTELNYRIRDSCGSSVWKNYLGKKDGLQKSKRTLCPREKSWWVKSDMENARNKQFKRYRRWSSLNQSG